MIIKEKGSWSVLKLQKQGHCCHPALCNRYFPDHGSKSNTWETTLLGLTKSRATKIQDLAPFPQWLYVNEANLYVNELIPDVEYRVWNCLT